LPFSQKYGNKDPFRISRIYSTLLHYVTVTVRFILILYSVTDCTFLWKPFHYRVHKHRQKRPISNQPYSVYTLITDCTFIEISVSKRVVLVYAVNTYGEWRYGSIHSYCRGWIEVSDRLYGSAVLSSW
jgi:hypothetical protein